MSDLPEYIVISDKMKREITGRVILSGIMGNSPHKFVRYNRTPEEFAGIVKGKTISDTYSKERWLFITLGDVYVLIFGECSGKINLLDIGKIPSKYHLLLNLDNGKSLYYFTKMWGAMELYNKGEELQRCYIRDMRPPPLDKEFSLNYYKELIASDPGKKSRNVKSLLTQNQFIPGLRNSIAQDIMLIAGARPKAKLVKLREDEIKKTLRSHSHENR